MNPSLQAAASLLAVAAVLAGCASADNRGGTDTVVHVQVDNEQRKTTVDFAPQPVDCARISRCPTLGASWSSATPNRAVLLVGTWGATMQVQAAEFDVRPYLPIRVRALATQGSDIPGVTAFVVPMDTLERIALGKNAYIKLDTDAGVVQESLIAGDSSSPAADALKRFIYEAYKGTDKEFSLGLTGIFADQPYAPNYDK